MGTKGLFELLTRKKVNKGIDGQFYHEELTPVQLTKHSSFKIDKILGKRVRSGILHYLVRWKVYSSDFDSWYLRSTHTIFRRKNYVQRF
jgi:hypothetical protein